MLETPYRVSPGSVSEFTAGPNLRRGILFALLCLLFIAGGLALLFIPPLRDTALREVIQRFVGGLGVVFGVVMLFLGWRMWFSTRVTVTPTEITSSHQTIGLPFDEVLALDIYRKYATTHARFLVFKVSNPHLYQHHDRWNMIPGFLGEDVVLFNLNMISRTDFDTVVARVTHALLARDPDIPVRVHD